MNISQAKRYEKHTTNHCRNSTHPNCELHIPSLELPIFMPKTKTYMDIKTPTEEDSNNV